MGQLAIWRLVLLAPSILLASSASLEEQSHVPPTPSGQTADPSPDSPPIVFKRNGVSVTVSAEPATSSNPETGTPAAAKVNVKIQAKKLAKVVPSHNYIVLSPENGPNYVLPPADYSSWALDGATSDDPDRWGDAPDSSGTGATDEWPDVEDMTVSDLDFLVNVDVLSGRFSVQLPDLTINGENYSLPPIMFEQP